NGREVDSPNYGHKLKWLGRLRQFLDDHCDPKAPLVLCGDFNIVPEDKDVYDPNRWREKNLCSTPEREALTNILNWGLRDSLRVYNQDAEVYSWWDYRQGMFGRNQGLRIDHLLVTRPVVSGLNAVEVHVDLRRLEKPSDHTPVVLDFEPL
ncbi:MAG: exodeoxyribonuclease III, partial [Candidatus Eisenbacteria bacterium]|nr:exodeoxyribonuclease III [Candidatus Eisenbacteria bacterium]